MLGKKISAFIGCLVMGLAAEITFSQEPSQADVTSKLKDQKEKLSKVISKEKSLYDELRDYSLRFDEIERQIADLQTQLSRLNALIEKNEARIQDIEAKQKQKQVEMGRLLNRMQRLDDQEVKSFLFQLDSYADFQSSQRAFQTWVEMDRENLVAYQKLLLDLADERSALEEKKQSQARLLTRLDQKREKLAGERRERKKLLALVTNQKVFYQQSIDELREAQKKLSKMFSRYGKNQRSSGFAAMKGKLPVPAKGKVEKRYGSYFDAKLKVKLYHKGVDIRAAHGSPVLSIFDGRVAYADWFSGYGKVVIVDHGSGYFTLYGHLSEIEKKRGDVVVVGDRIGRVGDTGSLRGSYLYFELRNKGLTEDPLPWLDTRSP